jgi:hypothetical protein
MRPAGSEVISMNSKLSLLGLAFFSLIRRRWQLSCAVVVAAAAGFAISSADAANIITFDDNANACGGAVICSTNGTTGYLKNGTGQAFDLSTITSWFQIDADGLNHLATQTQAEPDGGAGGFLVLNNTGVTVTSFSLTITDTLYVVDIVGRLLRRRRRADMRQLSGE